MTRSNPKNPVRFVDLLIFLLQTQGETLKRLAAFFGEEEFIEILESQETSPVKAAHADPASKFEPDLEWFQEIEGMPGSPYLELEDAVRELGLPAPLEFHLWAYGFYRSLIESGVELKSVILPSVSNEDGTIDPLDVLIAESIKQAKAWITGLPIPSTVYLQAESAALTPWVRFRARVLSRAGRKVLSAI
ncbi:MAG: hypothetical protein HYX41_00990 [Bdellovibrio sp.]|nr:hypothetical protein [Bdellovibrio sp.]